MASFSGDIHAVASEVESNSKFLIVFVILVTHGTFTERVLRSARAALSRAQKDTQDSFRRYKSCLDIEAQALQQVNAAEERRDALSECPISLHVANTHIYISISVASLMEAYRAESEGKFIYVRFLVPTDAELVSETSSRKSFAAEESSSSTVAAVEQRSSPKQMHDQMSCS